MTSVSQNTSIIRSFWPIIKSLHPLTVVREMAAAKLAAQSVTRAHIANLVHAEIIPRLASSQTQPEVQTQGASATAANASSCLPERLFSEAELRNAAALALAHDEIPLLAKVHELLDSGMSTISISEEYIGQTARYLGECWSQDDLSFTQVTLGCGRLQSMIHYLSDLTPLPMGAMGSAANSLQVLLVTAPQEQHSLGLIMVADAFRREGWEVSQASAHDVLTPLQTLKTHWFDVVGISIGADKQLPWVKTFIEQLREHSRNPDVKVLAGGPSVSADPAKSATYAQYGVDACATSASLTPFIARHLLSRATMAASVK
jgi:MerR family transcriptional regulator, light-induced transcriptional regulator